MKRPIIFAISLALLVASATAAEFHVAPTGADTNPGTAARPFATLERARDAARQAGGATITLAAGTYRLTKTFALGQRDSGTGSAPVVWKAAGDGAVVISGGISIPTAAFHAVTDKTTLARLPPRADNPALELFEIRLKDLGQGGFPSLDSRLWPELFQDGKPLPLSAWPNGAGYANGFKPAKIVSAHNPMRFAVSSERVKRWKSAMDTFHAQVWFGGHWYWDWADDFLPASSISDDGVVRMGKPHGYGLGPYANLHVYNLAEEMDAPGEYALEPSQNRLLVLLPKGDTGHKFVLSWLGEPLVSVEKAAHLRFEGIRFAYGRSDGVRVVAGEDIAFRHCTFAAMRAGGATVSGRQITVEDCLFEQIGATGVALQGGDSQTLAPAGNRVSHCEFNGFGRIKRTYAPAVSLNGVGSTVENCLMHDSPHSAILYGGQEHLIRNNEIHHVLTETGDCGAIYAGRDWTTFGTVISGNWIHDLGGLPGRWPCGIYLDDQLSGITVKNNFVERVSLGILVGGGRYDIVEGNIFAHCDEAMHLDNRGMSKGNNQTLLERLAKIPAASEPWTSRYPVVQNTLKDQPENPVGTRITGNAAVACKVAWRSKSPAGVATVAPNWEKLPAGSLREQGREVKVEGTSLVFTKPEVGVRKDRPASNLR